jgi:uncharacterized membrane protein
MLSIYTIIGGDQKEYGPISADDVRQWIAEGRLNEQSLVKGEHDAEFRPLKKFPEFAADFVPKMSPLAGAAPGRDYELDMFGCLTRGWELVKENMSVLFVGTLLFLLIQLAINALARIPLLGLIFSLANFVISGPLLGGVLYMFIRAIRREPAEVGDVFSGFRRAFAQLFLCTLVQSLLIAVCLTPFFVVLIFKFAQQAGLFSHLESGAVPDQQTLAALGSIMLASLPVLVLCAIPATYLGVCWKFALPLIIDKQVDFWTAMNASRRMVNKHWWHVFGLIVLIDLLNVAGLCFCCVGMFITMPVGFAALMFAYETIFAERQTA